MSYDGNKWDYIAELSNAGVSEESLYWLEQAYTRSERLAARNFRSNVEAKAVTAHWDMVENAIAERVHLREISTLEHDVEGAIRHKYAACDAAWAEICMLRKNILQYVEWADRSLLLATLVAAEVRSVRYQIKD